MIRERIFHAINGKLNEVHRALQSAQSPYFSFGWNYSRGESKNQNGSCFKWMFFSRALWIQRLPGKRMTMNHPIQLTTIFAISTSIYVFSAFLSNKIQNKSERQIFHRKTIVDSNARTRECIWSWDTRRFTTEYENCSEGGQAKR